MWGTISPHVYPGQSPYHAVLKLSILCLPVLKPGTLSSIGVLLLSNTVSGVLGNMGLNCVGPSAGSQLLQVSTYYVQYTG